MVNKRSKHMKKLSGKVTKSENDLHGNSCELWSAKKVECKRKSDENNLRQTRSEGMRLILRNP